MSKPPPLPAAVLARVLRIARIDGGTLVFIAGGFALVSAFYSDWLGAAVGGLAAGAGLIELHGRGRLNAGDIHGVIWLVRSQIVLLTIILLYVAYRFHSFDPQPMIEQIEHVLASVQRASGMEVTSLAEYLGLTNKELPVFAKSAVHSTYVIIGITSILCQGGLAYYYHSKGPVIAQALRKT